jgi:inner membrane transporter RhtA
VTTTAPAAQHPSTVTAAGTRLGVGLVLCGQLAQQVGAAVATGLFDRVGPVGVVGLRLAVSAVVLLALCRPSLRAVRRAGWRVVVGYGGALAGMNVLFYEAVARMPLGTAVTLEILGPLTLSVLASRRLLSVLWAVLALTGVVLLTSGGLTDLDVVGVGCALGAGALWACYILTAQRSATTLAGLDGLALAMAVGAVVVAPFSLAAAGPALFSPAVLAVGGVVATLSSLLPHALEAISLRRLASSTFAVLMSLAPAVAAITGAVLWASASTRSAGWPSPAWSPPARGPSQPRPGSTGDDRGVGGGGTRPGEPQADRVVGAEQVDAQGRHDLGLVRVVDDPHGDQQSEGVHPVDHGGVVPHVGDVQVDVGQPARPGTQCGPVRVEPGCHDQRPRDGAAPGQRRRGAQVERRRRDPVRAGPPPAPVRQQRGEQPGGALRVGAAGLRLDLGRHVRPVDGGEVEHLREGRDPGAAGQVDTA